MKSVFFGTPQFATIILDELKARGFIPSLIVTQPDKPVGRKQTLTPPPVKVWADEHGIDTIQPARLKDDPEIDAVLNSEWDMFIVAAYGLLLPKAVLDVPKYGVLNVHPSLLPKYRGPSPVQSQILHDDPDCGVSIMLLDEQMDHGPTLTQASVSIDESDWPLQATTLNDLLWHEGGKLLAETIPLWTGAHITPQEQDHTQAIYTKQFKKEDGCIDIEHRDAYQNYLKYCALTPWPGTHFFVDQGDEKIRVKIVEAEYSDGTFMPIRVIPEGKKELTYSSFLQKTN